MAVELTIENAEQLLKGVSIPPRPTLLVEINEELKKPDPDLKRIASAIAKDVGISAAVLKTVNSPLFGLRNKVGNVLQAVQLLGAKNVRNIVTGLVLRLALGGKNLSLERFWDSAEKVAGIAVYLCGLIPKSPRDDAYTFGIFHDCGIPILMQRFPDYKDTLKLAAGDDRPLTAVEDERQGTNHAVVGYMVAKSWGLPLYLCEAILRHHDISLFSPKDSAEPVVRNLVAINMLAEHLNDTVLRMRADDSWKHVGETVMGHLGLGDEEYQELKEDIVSLTA